MSSLVCVAEHFILGGVESYYVRMFKWAFSHGMKNCLIYDGKYADEWTDALRSYEVSVFRMKSISIHPKLEGHCEHQNNLESAIDFSEDIFCICFSFGKYLQMKRLLPSSAKIIIYALHPEQAIVSKNFQIINRLARYKWIGELVKNHIIFMDSLCEDLFNETYNENLSEDYIFNLGMEITPFEQQLAENKVNNEKFRILTICRMEFPFKGYVLGLLDVCRKIFEQHKDMELWVIGDGVDFEKMYKKYDSFPTNIKERIHIEKSVPYEELNRYFDITNVYVGMGTTVLDAVNRGVPAIVTPAYQEEDYSFGLFSPKCMCVGDLFENMPKLQYEKLEDVIEQVYDCSKSEYVEMCRESHNLLDKHYGIDDKMNRMINMKIESENGCGLFVFEMFFWVKRFVIKMRSFIIGDRI